MVALLSLAISSSMLPSKPLAYLYARETKAQTDAATVLTIRRGSRIAATSLSKV